LNLKMDLCCECSRLRLWLRVQETKFMHYSSLVTWSTLIN